MVENKDRWSALSMSERADLIKLYVGNGITSLNDIKKDYNSFTTYKEEKPSSINQSLQEFRVNKFGPGGEVETKENSLIKDIARDLAYQIIVQKGVSDKGKANIGEIITGIANTEPIVDDNKKMFLYGNINGLYPASDDKGFDFTSYLQQNYPGRVIKSYQGEINPYGEYVFDEKVKGLIEEMAKKKKHIYSNADDEYLHHITIPNPDTRNNPTAEFMDVGYRDDVHSYPLKFDVDSNGNPIAHAADLYDFNAKEYLKEFKPLKALQAHLLTSVGNPYILRQDNIPVKFIDLNGKSDYSPRVNYNGSIYDNDLTDEERRAVNFNWILKNITDEKVANILDSGYIEPAVVTSEYKKANGGKINKFEDGGNTSSTETSTQVVEGFTQNSNPYKYSILNIPYDRTTALNRVKPFFVTDENGNFVKGADGKVISSILGNILNTQLQPLRDIKGKDYYAPGSPHIGESNRGEQPASSDAGQFLLNWYNSPKTIDIIKKEAETYKTNVFQDIPYTDESGNTMMYSPTPEDAVALRSRLASEVPEYKDVPMQNNNVAYYRPKTSFTEAPSLDGKVFNVVQNINGSNMYLGPSIQYGNNESENSGSWVPLHEQNHAFQHQLLPSYFKDKDLGLEHDELKSEQHSYLMALRASLGLNPEKRDYTKEDAQQMIEALQNVHSGSAGPNKLLKVINNDAGTLAHMLNTWAAADDPEEVKKELTLKYSKGGRILDGKTKRMYGGSNDNFRSVAKMNARKLSSKILK